MNSPKALITGGSRGVGEASALALAERGYDIAITYREKVRRANEVLEKISKLGREAVAFGGDITIPEDRARLVEEVRSWTPSLDALVLNASGGLEFQRLQENPNYPKLINIDAQIGLVEDFEPLLKNGSTIAYVTSHWAHLYGEVEQLPGYESVAESKHLGESALRGMQPELSSSGIRLIVATGDLIEGTITAKLLERKQPGLSDSRRNDSGNLITTIDMGVAIADAINNQDLASGSTIVVGAPLYSLK